MPHRWPTAGRWSPKSLRRGRAGAANLVLTSTGAAQAPPGPCRSWGRHPVGAAPLVPVRLRGGPLDRGAHAQPVVDDHVHDRQPPQRRQVQRLVERPMLVVPSPSRHITASASGPARRGRPAPVPRRWPAGSARRRCRTRQAAAPPRRTSASTHPPSGHAGRLAEQLGHDPAGFQPAGQGIAVLPVCREQVVACHGGHQPTTVASSPRLRWQ
jgi:hypothetical protein